MRGDTDLELWLVPEAPAPLVFRFEDAAAAAAFADRIRLGCPAARIRMRPSIEQTRDTQPGDRIDAVRR